MERFARMCFNWKVLAALMGIGITVWIATPSLLLQALPLLLLAACPLSMFFMMRGKHERYMRHAHAEPQGAPPPGQGADAPLEGMENEAKELPRQVARLQAESKVGETSNN